MINPEKIRLTSKLKLWDTPGFLQFIEDLSLTKGSECEIKGVVSSLKRIYENKLKELEPKRKYKQTKLDL